MAVGAEIILEVASPQAIVRGLQPIHAMEMPSLASALEPRENEESPPVRLANLLLGKLAVGEITAARLRVGPGTELVGRGPGGVFDVRLLASDKLVAPLPMELGVRLAHMAGMELAPQLAAVMPQLFEAGNALADQLRQGLLGTFEGENLGAAMAQLWALRKSPPPESP